MTQANTSGLFPDGRRLWPNLPLYTEAGLASPLTASRRMSNYESDDAYPHSPGLKAVRVKATPSPLPPPFIPQQITITSPENVSPHSLKERKKPNQRNTGPSQGDTVLVNLMDPNRPDIARLAGERALNSDSGSSRNPALALNIDTSELLLPQAIHAQDLLLQQQNMSGQRIPPQSNNTGAVPNAQPGGQAPQARMVSQAVPLTQMQARSGPQILQGMQHGSVRKRNAQFHTSLETSPTDVYPAAARNAAQKPFPRKSSSNAYDMKDADAAKDGIFKETEPVLCIKHTISEDITKGEQARNKARLSAIADRPRILGSKRSSVGFAHDRTSIEAHGNRATLPLKDRPGFFMPPRDDLQKKAQPASPHNSTEWLTLMAQGLELRLGPKRARPNTSPRSFSPRRDGIRKKNARFDIPPERSLLNIDVLIQNSTNDEEIKELKQQKRLLRNRQAALDSQQRKKKYTEEVANMRLQIDSLLREKEQWHLEQVETQQIMDQLVRSHTLETSELRKKVSVLTERLANQSPTFQY